MIANLFVLYKLIQRSKVTLDRTVLLQPGEDSSATYCVFSKYQILGAKYFCYWCMIYQLNNILSLALGKHYAKLWFGSENHSCETRPRDPNKQWRYIFDTIKPLSMLFLKNSLVIMLNIIMHTMFLLNIYEWIAMWYIIKSQQHRDVNQILYDFNTEEMGTKSLNYRKNEFKIAKAM
jgi:hypothetical protein